MWKDASSYCIPISLLAHFQHTNIVCVCELSYQENACNAQPALNYQACDDECRLCLLLHRRPAHHLIPRRRRLWLLPHPHCLQLRCPNICLLSLTSSAICTYPLCISPSFTIQFSESRVPPPTQAYVPHLAFLSVYSSGVLPTLRLDCVIAVEEADVTFCLNNTFVGFNALPP